MSSVRLVIDKRTKVAWTQSKPSLKLIITIQKYNKILVSCLLQFNLYLIEHINGYSVIVSFSVLLVQNQVLLL